MSKAYKKAEPGRGPFRRLSDSEILLFVSRTLRPHLSEPETPDVFAKLQSLKDIFDQQEVNLLDWPHSPSKDRLYASLLRAKRLLAQIADDIHSAARSDTAAPAATA